MKLSKSKRFAVLAYGLTAYLMFLGVFVYAIGFIGNFLVPTTLDAPKQGSLTMALVVNCLLLTAFAVQHSGMARPSFKKWWTKIVPKPIERSTYVLFSNIAMILLFWLWQPMGGVVWQVENEVIRIFVYVMFACGWVTILYSTMLISHFDLFGLRQVWLYFQQKPYTQLEFRVPGLYRFVRHPLYVGWLIVFWAAPTMTIAHLMFASITTIYILVAIRLEERNLVDALPGYSEYQKQVPMLCPMPTKSSTKSEAVVHSQM